MYVDLYTRIIILLSRCSCVLPVVREQDSYLLNPTDRPTYFHGARALLKCSCHPLTLQPQYVRVWKYHYCSSRKFLVCWYSASKVRGKFTRRRTSVEPCTHNIISFISKSTFTMPMAQSPIDQGVGTLHLDTNSTRCSVEQTAGRPQRSIEPPSPTGGDRGSPAAAYVGGLVGSFVLYRRHRRRRPRRPPQGAAAVE